MTTIVAQIASTASAGTAVLLALLLVLRHILLTKVTRSQERLIEAPIVFLIGMLLVYVIANLLLTPT